MAVRVRIRIDPTNHGGESLEGVVVLNGGFESERPCLLLPMAAAVKVLPEPLGENDRISAEVAGGETSFLLARETLRIHVVTPDRGGPSVDCFVIVSEGDREMLVSDTAIDALGVEIKSFGKGLWRFADEERLRSSEPAQYW